MKDLKELIARVKQLSEEKLPDAIKLREAIHMEPELCYEEFKTAEKIKKELDKAGIEYRDGIGKTGIVGVIRGGKPGKTVFLRADIDALPIEEKADVPYKSTIPGKSHTCGHDGNTGALLGALLVLNEMKDELPGNVTFGFQPAEEGGAGAVHIVNSGILEDPKADASFAIHVNAFYPPGTIAMKYGQGQATALKFNITFTGVKGVRSVPGATVDPVGILGEFIARLEGSLHRAIAPWQPFYISYSDLKNDTAACTASVTGQVRCYDLGVWETAKDVCEKVLKSVTATLGATYTVEYGGSYPPMFNDLDLCYFAEGVLKERYGAEAIKRHPMVLSGGEDYAYVCQKVPGVFLMVGIAEWPTLQHHDPDFYFDSKNLIYGIEAYAQCTAAYLFENAKGE